MQCTRTTRWTRAAAVLALLIVTASAPGDEPAAAPAAPTEQTTQITVDVNLVKPGQYWLGIMCTPLDDELLKAQLGVEHGLVVREVVGDSPAAKAGLQEHDILIQVGDQALADLRTLVAQIEETGERALTLTFLRQGERQTVEVTPVKRPAESEANTAKADKEAADEWKMLQENLYQMQVPKIIQEEQQDGTKMLFIMPGVVLSDHAQSFPKDLEVTITKKGDETARIIVQRGDDRWEVDANSLEKLPEDIRPHITQMLWGTVSIAVGDNHISWSSDAPQSLVLPEITTDILKSFKAAPTLRREFRGLADKIPQQVRDMIKQGLKDAQQQMEAAPNAVPAEALDQIRQELQELREQLEQLRAERAAPAPPETDAEQTADSPGAARQGL